MGVTYALRPLANLPALATKGGCGLLPVSWTPC